MKKQLLILAMSLATYATTYSQNIGINTTMPHPSSELDITSTTKGFLAPRMTHVQRNAIVAPATGLLIYQTDFTAGFYVYNGTAWTPMNNPEGLFKVYDNKISYSDTSHFGKPFLVNTDTVNFDGVVGGGDLRYRMMFLPAKNGAFRVGGILGKNWDMDSIGDGSFASGFATTATGNSSIATGVASIASGDYSIAMGFSAVASGRSSTAMGDDVEATGDYATAMGESVEATGDYATAMGYNTTASGEFSTAMGYNTTASGTISNAMGTITIASGDFSTAMGNETTASGDYSTAMGNYTTASGDYSTTIGRYVQLNSTASGSMYLADALRTSSAQSSSGTVSNRFYARFDNGYYLYTDGIGNYGVSMQHQGNSWSTISDSTKKENYKAAPDFLSKIAQMKIGSWNYKGQDKQTLRHYGPYAQEFYYHFGNDGVGTVGNDTTIASADIDGVMMIAIQQLIKENEALKAEIKQQENRVSTQNERLEKVEALLEETKYAQK